jgi:hypothetical protein
MFEKLGDFVGAEIECANDDREILAGIEDPGVGFEVIGFGGFAISAEKEEFGAIKPDAISTSGDAVADFFGEFDVAADGDSMSVDGFGGELFDLSESFADALAAGLRIKDAGERISVGINEDLTVVAIENCVFSAGNGSEAAAKADDGGDFECSGEDRSVAGLAADFGGEAENEACVESGCFARGEFVCEEDDGLGEVTEFFAAFAEELAEESFFEIEDVESAFGEVAVAEFFELFSVSAKHATDGGFRGPAVVADETFDFADEPRVLGHLEVGGEDGTVLLTQLGGDELFVGLNIATDVFEGEVEAVQFGIDCVAGDIASGNTEVFGTQYKNRARDNSGRNSDASEDLHPVDSSGNSGQRKGTRGMEGAVERPAGRKLNVT